MKQQLFKNLLWLIPIIALVWGFGFLFADDQKLVFEDPAFEQAIRTELQLEDGDIRKDMLNRVEQLSIPNNGIRSIEGIQAFESLVSLDASGNQITDLQPLARMNRIESLQVRDNQVENLEALSSLRALTSLDVRGNNVATLEPIEELTNLQSLNIRENNIESLQPLQNMTVLRDLNARYNNIDSVGVLTQLSELRERLYLEGNPIQDWIVLSDLYDQIKDKDFARPEHQLVFSDEGGLYEQAIDVAISTLGEAEGVIRYTTDGSEPDESSDIYSAPLHLEENTVVRARFYAEGIEQSAQVTHSYLIGVDTTLPIVSISTAPANLYDREIGIYVPGIYYNPEAPNPEHTGNFAQSGTEWERPIHLEFFEENGERVLSQGAGIRMHGGASRTVPRKSFRLYARSDYGENRFRYPFFEEDTREEYNRLLLRNSGNDWNNTLFRDAMLQELIRDFDVETQLYRPSTLFVNGEYWGIYNLRERFDNHYYEIKHGVDPQNLDFLENDAVIREGTNDDYLALLAYMEENGAASAEAYEFISSQVDMNNFIDYQIAQIFVRNTDWPGNNIRYWRERPDGKWRWSVFDLDFGFDLPAAAGTVAHDTFAFATARGGTSWPNPDWSTFMLRTLLENETFSETFLTRFAHYLNTNFEADHVIQTIDEMAAVIAPEMEQHIERWEAPESIEDWEQEVETMRQFAQMRPHIVQGQLMHHFDVRGLGDLTIDSVHQDIDWTIAGRTANELASGWTGAYFTDAPIDFSFAIDEPIDIESSDLDVAAISEEGELLLLEEGTASVRFSSPEHGTLLELSVTVTHMDQEEVILETGQTISLTSEEAVHWETSDAEIVSVEQNGTIKANDVGHVIITGHDQSGTVVKVASVTSKTVARTASYYNADDMIFTYDGLWQQSTLADHRENLASFSDDTEATVSFTFEGTGFRWIGYRGRTQGIADVFINGEHVAEVDTYDSEAAFQQTLYEVSGLNKGEHTVTISVKGTSRPEAENQRIHVDGIEVINN